MSCDSKSGFEEPNASNSDASEAFGVIDTSDSGLSPETIKQEVKSKLKRKMVKQEKSDGEISQYVSAKKSKKKHKHLNNEVESPNVTYSDACHLGLQASTPLSTNSDKKNKYKDYLTSSDMSKIPNEIDNMLDSGLKHKKEVSQKTNYDNTESNDIKHSKKQKKSKLLSENTCKNYYDDHVKIDIDENCLKKENNNETNSLIGTKKINLHNKLTRTRDTQETNESIDEASEIQNSNELAKKVKREKRKSKKQTHALLDSQSQDLDTNDGLSTVMDSHFGNDTEDTNCSEKTIRKKHKFKQKQTLEDLKPEHSIENHSLKKKNKKSLDISNMKSQTDNLQLPHDSPNESSRNADKLDNTESESDMQNTDTTPTTKHKKHSSFSELIKFEEDNNEDTRLDPMIQNYLESNPHLKPVSDCGPKIEIGDDDEIWVVTCPSDIPAESFKDLNINLNGKTKLKVEGQSYEGIIEEEDNRIGLLTSGETKGSFQIRNINPVASIKFRRKLPKPNFNLSSTLENLQTDLIPLPETKTRHPLFGADYLEYINLPQHIREKLNRPAKKHKKKTKQEGLEFHDDIKSETSSSKKKKKRKKPSDTEDETVVKHKKIKKDPDYKQVWDSDKAIEESLFNF